MTDCVMTQPPTSFNPLTSDGPIQDDFYAESPVFIPKSPVSSPEPARVFVFDPEAFALQGPPPNNHLIWAIVSTVLFFFPFGVPAIVYASQVNSKWAIGDSDGANTSAAKAKTWAMWATIVPASVCLLCFLTAIVIMATAG